jgi:mannose-1-phosphate guanylyltransferase
MAIHAVIMAGGSGTRFWPLSRGARPKQLLALGPSEHSLLRCTVERIAPLIASERTWVVTTRRIADAVACDLPELPRGNVLAEPEGRNTAPCIGWAAVRASHADPDAVLVVLPADHHIADEPAFRAVLERAIAAASDGGLVTCGIEPTRPDTGFGYLQVDADASREAAGVRRCVRFVEKPDLARATEFVASGNYLWNSGLFVFRADAILAAIAKHIPELSAELDAVRAALEADGSDERVIDARYAHMPSISIDHGVMERVGDVLVVPGAFGWSDLGSYETAWELAPKDAAGNALRGDALAFDASRNFVRVPEGKLVALIGVDDLVVVDTGDTLLVMPRTRSQDVRRVVDALASRGDGRR